MGNTAGSRRVKAKRCAGWIVALAAIGVLLSVGAAGGDAPSPATLRVDGGYLSIAGQFGFDKILINREAHTHGSKILVSDSRGLDYSGGAACDLLTRGIYRCQMPRSMSLFGQGGPDRIIVDTKLPFTPFLWGQSGDDHLNDFKGKSHEDGGPGSDRLLGGPGADYLSGERGVDKLFGGAGTDTLEARFSKSDTDERIDCGVGRDQAVLDAADPIPEHCEKVRVR